MRVLYCEWKKAISVPFLWILMLALLAINGYAQIAGTRARPYSPDEYRHLYSALSDMSFAEAEQYLEEQMDLTASGGSSMYSWELLDETEQKRQAIMNYQDYLANIESQSQIMMSISIWDDADTFSHRSIQKTPLAYQKMKGTVPVLTPSIGIEDALENPITDLIDVFFAFLSVSIVMLKDREQGMQSLLFSLPEGRGFLFCQKSILITLLIVCYTGFLIAENLLIGFIMYGCGDLSAPVQSISILYQCNLPISLGEYLILYYYMKAAAMLLFAALFMMICIISHSNLTVFSLCVFACGISLLLYKKIQGLSAFGILHYLNPVQFLHVNEIIGSYCNVNVLGYPFSLKWVSCITIIIMLPVLVVLSGLRFTSSYNQQYRTITLPILRTCSDKIHGQFYYVCYRSLIQNKGIYVVMLAVIVALGFSASFQRVYSSDNIYYEKYTTQYEGPVTQDILDFLNEKNAYYSDIYDQISQFSDNSVNFQAISELSLKLNDEPSVLRLQNRVEAIQENQKNGRVFYDTGYERLFGIDGNHDDFVIILFEMLFLTMLLSSYAAQDRKLQMTKIIASTASGMVGYWKYLFVYSILCGLIISMLFNFPYVYHILCSYGSQGIEAPLQSMTAFADQDGCITVGTEILILLAVRMVSTALTAVLINLISYYMRSPLIAFIVNLSLFVLPVVLALLGVDAFGEIGLIPFLSYNRLLF